MCGKLKEFSIRLRAFLDLVPKLNGIGIANPDTAKEVEGVGMLLDIAHQLSKSSLLLYDHDQCYSMAALTRQQVEVEYLMWAFANGHGDGKTWLSSNRAGRMKVFSPSNIRKKSSGAFRDCDYQYHCEVGGHPTPSGSVLLANDAHTRKVNLELFRYDELAHCKGIFYEFGNWANKFGVAQIISNELYQEVMSTVTHWLRSDPLTQVPPPPSGGPP
jgi:hypothetical protein